MTSRERVISAFNHQEPDRTPIFEYVLLPPLASEILGRLYLDFGGEAEPWLDYAREIGWEKAVRQYAIDRVELAEKLKHDLIYAIPCPPLPSGNPLAQDELPDDPVARVRLRVPEDFSIITGPSDQSLLVYMLIQEEMQRRGLVLPLLAPAYTHGIWTDTDLMETIALEPEVARMHFKTCTQYSLKCIEKYHNLGIEIVGIGGDFAGSRPLISPASYRDLIMPELKVLSDKARELGMLSVNASDGDLWLVIEDFLIGAGVDGYLEIDQFAGMDLAILKRRYGDKITLIGNMDCGNVLSFSSPESVRAKTKECLDAGRGSGGHIFSASNAITASVPYENYAAMVEAYWDYWDLASPL